MKRRRRSEPRTQPRIERPELLPVYVYIPGPSDHERQLRGLAFFEELQRSGMEVIIADTKKSVAIPIRSPLTIIYASVVVEDRAEWITRLRSYEDGRPTPLVYIMDCHFPITDSTHINVGGDLAANVTLLDAIPTIFSNLALADAVTVPNSDWATDLLAEHPDLPVFVLPDITPDDPQSGNTFAVRFVEIVMTAWGQRRQAIMRGHQGGH